MATTGGDGFALPAGICNLINPTIFFAIVKPLNHKQAIRFKACGTINGLSSAKRLYRANRNRQRRFKLFLRLFRPENIPVRRVSNGRKWKQKLSNGLFRRLIRSSRFWFRPKRLLKSAADRKSTPNASFSRAMFWSKWI